MAGAANTAQLLYWRDFGAHPLGSHLPSARAISNMISSTGGRDVPNAIGVSEFATFFGQVRRLSVSLGGSRLVLVSFTLNQAAI